MNIIAVYYTYPAVAHPDRFGVHDYVGLDEYGLPSAYFEPINTPLDGPSACQWLIPEGPAFTIPEDDVFVVYSLGLVNPDLYVADDFGQALDLFIVPINTPDDGPSACQWRVPV